jgi:antitoxin HigA-1
MTTKPMQTLIPRPRVEQMAEPPTHPGEVLREDFLVPLGMTQTAFAARLGISLQRLNDLLCGRRGVTVDTALRLARVLGTSAQFWINLHDARELWEAVHGPNAEEIEKLEPLHHDREGRLVGSA